MEEFAHAHISPGMTHRMFDIEHPAHPGETCAQYDNKMAALEDWQTTGVRENYNTYEPAPKGNGTVILPLVLEDLRQRAETGKVKYGTFLRANNGRDPLVDAYQEAMDLVMYLRQAIEERNVTVSPGGVA